MKLTELRIGNSFKGSWGKGTYLQVRLDHLAAWGGIYGQFPLPNPIELTPEVLEKAGFIKSANKNKNVWYWEFVRDGDELKSYVFVGRIDTDPAGMYQYGFESPRSSVNINNIFYLHTLQNVFFALTGKELTVNI